MGETRHVIQTPDRSRHCSSGRMRGCEYHKFVQLRGPAGRDVPSNPEKICAVVVTHCLFMMSQALVVLQQLPPDTLARKRNIHNSHSLGLTPLRRPIAASLYRVHLIVRGAFRCSIDRQLRHLSMVRDQATIWKARCSPNYNVLTRRLQGA